MKLPELLLNKVSSELAESVHISKFGVKGDGTDETTKIQQAFDYIIQNGCELQFDVSKVYGISSPILLDNTPNIAVAGCKIKGNGEGGYTEFGTTFKWLGALTSGAMFIAKNKNFIFNAFENVGFDGSNNIDYAIQLDSKDTIQNKDWEFNRCYFLFLNRAAVLIGHDETNTTYDSDIHNNIFNHCIFEHVPIGVVLNVSENLYQTVLKHCSLSPGSKSGINLVRNLRGHNLVLENCFCHYLTSEDTTTAVIYSQDGAVTVNTMHTEESRIFLCNNYGGHSADNVFSISNLTINEGNGNDVDQRYVFYSNAGYDMVLINCQTTFNDAYSRKIKCNGKLTASNVFLGVNGDYELDNPDYCIIEGIRPGTIQPLVRNWAMSKWYDSDKPMDWSPQFPNGAIGTLTQDTAHVVFGQYTCLINVTTASDTACGIVCSLPATFENKKGMVIVATGYLEDPVNQDVSFLATEQTIGTYVKKYGNQFVAVTYIQNLNGDYFPSITFGLASGKTGKIWIDTIIPVTVDLSQYIPAVRALFQYAPNSYKERDVYYAPYAPTVGVWNNGDIVKNSNPSVGIPKGWVRASGAWVSEGNL